MPQRSGFEMILRLHEACSGLTAMPMSGKVDVKCDSLRILMPMPDSAEGCFLVKPFSPSELIHAVRESLARVRTL